MVDQRLAAALGGRCPEAGYVVTETLSDTELTPAGLRGLDDLPEMQGAATDDWVYLDTETTGLSGGTGTLAFMVGVARFAPDARLQVRQYILARFGAESAMLAALADWIGDRATLVSFNGRCFDMPLLAARFQLHRRRCPLARRPHLDLMYSVRRAYRKAWPDCRLQTAEQRRLSLNRVGDLPGAQAPMAWRAWLRLQTASMLAAVLRHNRQDLVSLARLHAAMVEDFARPTRPDVDPGAIGQAWADAGEPGRALAIWSQHRDRLDEPAALRLAATYRRMGRWLEAEAVWLTLHRRGCREAALALSKYHEHQRRDYRRAIGFAEASDHLNDDQRRRRLRRKLEAQSAGPNLDLPLMPPGERDTIASQVSSAVSTK